MSCDVINTKHVYKTHMNSQYTCAQIRFIQHKLSINIIIIHHSPVFAMRLLVKEILRHYMRASNYKKISFKHLEV